MIIGITGCPGSGKSFLSRVIESHGWTLVDADMLGKAVVDNDSDVLDALKTVFGNDIVFPDGKTDRRTLAVRAFSTPENTIILNEIVHPVLLKKLGVVIDKLRSEKKNAVVDCALIYEWNIGSFFDILVCVTADEDIRRNRIITRDGRSAEEVDGMFAAQFSQDLKASKSDIVIKNNSKTGLLEAFGEMLAGLPLLMKNCDF